MSAIPFRRRSSRPEGPIAVQEAWFDVLLMSYVDWPDRCHASFVDSWSFDTSRALTGAVKRGAALVDAVRKDEVPPALTGALSTVGTRRAEDQLDAILHDRSVAVRVEWGSWRATIDARLSDTEAEAERTLWRARADAREGAAWRAEVWGDEAEIANIEFFPLRGYGSLLDDDCEPWQVR